MGWSYRNKPAYVSAKEEITRELTCDNEHGRWTVLRIAMKGGVAYAATEYILKTKKGVLRMKTRRVFGTVVLTGYDRKDYYNFGTKIVDESMGPYECECPANILNLLTPTTNEHSKSWRETCWAKLAKAATMPKLAEGDVIKFKSPLPFGSYGKADELTIVDKKRRHYQASFGLCRLRRDTLKYRDYSIYRGGKLLAQIAA